MSSASTPQPGSEGWKMADMEHITARPFIESVVHPHPVVVDSETKKPLVPVIPSTLSPQKPEDLAQAAAVDTEPPKRLTVTAMPFYQSMVHPHPVVVDNARQPIVPIVPSSLTPEKQELPKSEEIAARSQAARLVAAKRSLHLGDGPQSVAVAIKDAQAYWAEQAAKTSGSAAAPAEQAEAAAKKVVDAVKASVNKLVKVVENADVSVQTDQVVAP